MPVHLKPVKRQSLPELYFKYDEHTESKTEIDEGGYVPGQEMQKSAIFDCKY